MKTKKLETSSEIKWKITENRFVAFLDILGFRDKVMRKTHEHIYDELKKISKFKENIEKRLALRSNPNYNDCDVYIVSFSDSIVLFSKNNSFENFEFFLVSLRAIFANSIREKIALKGGIAHGLISLDKENQIYFGQPIIDAYLIEEDVNYLGVVAHSSIDEYLYLNKIKVRTSAMVNQLLFEEKANLKSGKITHFNLDWFILTQREYDSLKPEEKISNIISDLNSFYVSVSGSPRRYIDNTLDILSISHSKKNINLKKLQFSL